jgi:hypothetical protein
MSAQKRMDIEVDKLAKAKKKAELALALAKRKLAAAKKTRRDGY